jgi:hypothetical protein
MFERNTGVASLSDVPSYVDGKSKSCLTRVLREDASFSNLISTYGSDSPLSSAAGKFLASNIVT